MPSRHEPLQFYATMNPNPGNGVPQKAFNSVSKRYSSSADCLPGKLNFYSSMSSSAPHYRTDSCAISGNQAMKQQPSASCGPVYTVRCETSATQQGKPATGQEFRIARKQEQVPPEFGGSITWEYTHDLQGHLVQARRNGLVAEEYVYDGKGARVHDIRNFGGMCAVRNFAYDGGGRLASAGERAFTWAADGSLKSMKDAKGTTAYYYGNDTRLDKVGLPDGTRIDYRYREGLLPVSVARNGLPVLEYEWQEGLRLKSFRDAREALTMIFHYGHQRLPQAVTLHGYEAIIQRITGICAASLRLDIHTDHLGSVRMLTIPQKNLHGSKAVQYIEYDSFGNVIACANPGFRFPLGFAGGLHDPFTGFVRFGYRDYDPVVGRFTAKDPLGDTGGDHDLWDYCVDDPVSMNDPTGLMPPLALYLLGMASATGAGVGVPYLVGSGIDAKNGNSAARDAIKRIAPAVAGTVAAGVLPGVMALTPGAAATALTGKYGGTISKVAPHVKDFIEGFAIPGPPAMTKGGGIGGITGILYDKLKKK